MADHLRRQERELLKTVDVKLDYRWRQLIEQLTVMQAVDVHFKRTGKLIIVAKVGGRDIVKIIDISPEYKYDDWKRLIEYIEQTHGAGLRFADTPHGYPPLKPGDLWY